MENFRSAERFAPRVFRIVRLFSAGLAICLSFTACRPKRADPFVAMAKKYSNGKYLALGDYYREAAGVKLGVKGIVIEAASDKTALAMDMIGSDFSGALPFVIEKNYGKDGQLDKIAVVATMDQFALVSALRSGGREDKVSTASVVKALRGINGKAKIKITGAGRDFVEFAFVEEPRDWAAVARDCAAIAPNIVVYGTGDVEKLEAELKRIRKAILWWN